MKNIIATILAALVLTIYFVPAGNPGDKPKRYVIENDTITLIEEEPEIQDFSKHIQLIEMPTQDEGVMQYIRGNAGEPVTASVLVTFVIE